MKFSLEWLYAHLTPPSGGDKSAVDQIVDTLIKIGLEVKSVIDRAQILDGFVVGEIVAIAPHPDADRLQLCDVSTGAEILRVICGAPNARLGMHGVFAPAGVIIPSSGAALTKAKIRGIESAGMLCSESELGLSDESDGIIELDDAITVGTPAAVALAFDDILFDIELTPNRPDCLGVRGIARDLAAAQCGTLKADPLEAITLPPVSSKKPPAILIEDASCPAFAGCLIRNIKNTASPAWLIRRLESAGLRSVNALVDITNYISYDRGRPLHVYDAAQLHGAIVVRRARDGEQFVGLDDKTYTLVSDDCVIADAQNVLGLGGIMGGATSGCSRATTDVFLESAWFVPASIARSGQHHNILSDARHRFERGVDRNSIMLGLNFAVAMIVDICGGEVSTPVHAGEIEAPCVKITFRPARVEQLTGFSPTVSEISATLIRLGFIIEAPTKSQWQVTVPSWRPDCDSEADLVEEVIRIYGFEQITSTPLPRVEQIVRPNIDAVASRPSFARRVLATRGMVEAITWSFVAADEAALFKGGDDLALANPISSALSHMRPSLLAGLLAAIARNRAHGIADIALFEVGNEFTAATPAAQRLAISGVRCGAYLPRNWQNSGRNATIWDVRADAQAVLAAFGVTPKQIQSKKISEIEGYSWYHPGRAGALYRAPHTPLAVFGALHPVIAAHFDISAPLVAFEIYPEALPVPPRRARRAPLDINPLQPVRRDFAFIIDKNISAADLIHAAQSVDKTIITEVRVFDVFTGDTLKDNMKSIAIEVILQPRNASFTDVEIKSISDKIIATCQNTTGATLR